jgi:hypothetical protein
MCSVPTEAPAAIRARWLAELSEALDSAQRLLARLNSVDADSAALELYARIEAARFEVRSLRLSRQGIQRNEDDPEWTGFIGWQSGGVASGQRPSGKSPPPAKGSR